MEEQAKKTLRILEEMTKEETHEPRRKYLGLNRAARSYRMNVARFAEKAKAAGAYYPLGNGSRGKVLINMDKMDEYFEKTGELKKRYPDDDESEEDENED